MALKIAVVALSIAVALVAANQIYTNIRLWQLSQQQQQLKQEQVRLQKQLSE